VSQSCNDLISSECNAWKWRNKGAIAPPPSFNNTRSSKQVEHPREMEAMRNNQRVKRRLEALPAWLRVPPVPTSSPPYTLHPSPYTLHPIPYTLHPTPCILHPTPYTLHPTPYTSHPTPCGYPRRARPLSSDLEHDKTVKVIIWPGKFQDGMNSYSGPLSSEEGTT